MFKKSIKGKKILVTGGAGAIGTNLVSVLLKNEAKEIYVIDNLSSGRAHTLLEHDKVNFFQKDIIDNEILEKIFDKGIDIVFHLAAHFANQNSVDYPERDLLTNVYGTVKLLRQSHKKGVKRFVYFNTSCMYSPEHGIFKEDSKEFQYDTPYSISKHTGELYSELFNEYYGLPTVGVRIFNSYGPHEYPGLYRNVIPNFFKRAMDGQALTVMGTGEETRSFTYVDDIVRGVMLAATKEGVIGEVFNIGSDREIKIIDLAKKINKVTGNTVPIEFIPRRDWDKTMRRCADLSKAKDLLGYETTVDIDDGLERTFKWFKL
ncbi:MAG: NAD-dependent epimerase/dehydratase family protein [Candidatus Pacebacteria bacterium]|nr:NAD-dependent epimerase/dehydratase family protein [Candidatus Paceibacterota bacterium]